jgi:hypothetical protein
MTRKEVIRIVHECLKKHKDKNWPLEVLEDGVRQDDDWWYVPVRPGQKRERGFEYYDLLARIEEELEDQKELNILLVPAGPD